MTLRIQNGEANVAGRWILDSLMKGFLKVLWYLLTHWHGTRCEQIRGDHFYLWILRQTGIRSLHKRLRMEQHARDSDCTGWRASSRVEYVGQVDQMMETASMMSIQRDLYSLAHDSPWQWSVWNSRHIRRFTTEGGYISCSLQASSKPEAQPLFTILLPEKLQMEFSFDS